MMGVTVLDHMMHRDTLKIEANNSNHINVLYSLYHLDSFVTVVHYKVQCDALKIDNNTNINILC